MNDFHHFHAQIKPLACLQLRKAATPRGSFRHEGVLAPPKEQPEVASDMVFDLIAATELFVKMLLPGTSRIVEEVLLAKGGIFPTQVGLFDNHMRFSIQNLLGKAFEFKRDESVWMGRGELTPDVQEAEDAWAKIKAGHLTDVSVGYTVQDFVAISPGHAERVDRRLWRAGDLPLRIATKWTVHELSLATIGADEAAKINVKPRRRSPVCFR